jgi:hypothetical protein
MFVQNFFGLLLIRLMLSLYKIMNFLKLRVDLLEVILEHLGYHINVFLPFL